MEEAISSVEVHFILPRKHVESSRNKILALRKNTMSRAVLGESSNHNIFWGVGVSVECTAQVLRFERVSYTFLGH